MRVRGRARTPGRGRGRAMPVDRQVSPLVTRNTAPGPACWMPAMACVRSKAAHWGLMFPPDGHVHSEWSWDAPAGSMEQTCARAAALGLPAVAFTEHADYTTWTVLDDGPDADEHLTAVAGPAGLL